VDIVSTLRAVTDQALIGQLREGLRPQVCEVCSGEMLQSIAQAVLGLAGVDTVAGGERAGAVLVVPERR